MRRIYITIVILLMGMIGMAYLYFSNLTTETEANDISLHTIASNAAVIFSFENDKSFYDILTGQDLLQDVLGAVKAEQFKALRTELANYKELSDVLAGQKVYVGFLPGSGNDIDYLITTQEHANSDVSKLLTSLSKKTNLKKRTNSYELLLPDSTSCFIGLKDKLIIVSNSSTTIEKVLLVKTKADLGFVNYIKANNKFATNTLATLYIDFASLPQLLKNILNTNLSGELGVFKNQKSYATLNYNFSDEKLLFNGTTEITGSTNYLKLFTKIPEQNISISNILPEKTANFTTYAISNYGTWYADLQSLQSDRKELSALTQRIKKIDEKYRVNVKEIFSNYFKNDFITFQLNTGEKFGALQLTNGEKVSQLLLDLTEEYDNGIRVFRDPQIPYTFFGDPFKNFEKPFYTIIDNHLIMANNASSIQSFLNSYSNNRLLINNEDYINFSNQLSASSTVAFYINHANSNEIFGRNIKVPYYRQYQATSGFKNYFAFSYQLSGENGKFQTNMMLYKKPQKVSAIDSLNKN